MAVRLNVLGNRYNRLTILEELPTDKYVRIVGCLCDCGNYSKVRLTNLRTGHTKSCGCQNDEKRKTSLLIHGMTSSPEYKSYRKMIERCYSPKDISYKNYGARGITVCNRWKESFINFYDDMGSKPGVNYSLDRVDSNGIYCKDNCKWATRKEQNSNRRNNVWIEYNGVKMILKEWATFLNTDYRNISKMMETKPFNEVYKFYMRKKHS